MFDYRDTDFLTGFYLKVGFYHFLKKLIFESEPQKRYFTIILIDLDRFKKLNDKFGHLVGDDILIYTSSVLCIFFPKELCFRYGGDEFIGVLPDKDPVEAFALALKIKAHMRKRPFRLKGMPFQITFSGGVAGFPSDGKTMEDIVKKADEAMYFSKHHGRGLITLAGRMKYITIRNILITLAGVLIVSISLFILYQSPLQEPIRYIVRDIKELRVTAEPRRLDTIILKNGRMLSGRVVGEDKDTITLSIPLEKGEASLVLQKSEILKIKYGRKREAK